jgi:hypothetical protein
MVMAMNSEYRGSASGVAAKKKAAARKTVVTPGTKVSQATIDKIKAMGMTKALKSAAAGTANAEMREGLKRLYGAKRLNAAETSTKPYNVRPSKPVAKSPDQARGAMSAPSKPVYKSADAARAAMPGKGPMVKVTAAKPVKKSGTTDPLARAIFGAAKAIRGGSNQGMTAAQVAAENKRRANAAKNK